MIWRSVVGADKYEVSDSGQVRSWRNSHGGRRSSPRLIKQHAKPSGHLYVVLTINGSEQIKRYVHRLVLEAFIGPAPDGTEGCHFDGIPANNELQNLRWATHKQNGEDTRRHRVKAGERHPMAKLSDADVMSIRASSDSTRSLCLKHGVSAKTVQRARNGRRLLAI